MYLLKISKKGEDIVDEDNGVLAVPEFQKVLKEKKGRRWQSLLERL